MKAAELRELADAELVEKLGEYKQELFNLRFQLVTGQLDDPTRLKQVRHDIARVLTVRRERERAAERQDASPAAAGQAAASEGDR